MNIFYSTQRNIKLRNKSQHHITILTLLFWVWKPPEKPQDGKTGAAIKYRFYYEKIWNFLQSLQIHPNLANAVPDKIRGQIPAKPQHPPLWVYDPAVRSSVILLLAPPFSQLNPPSNFLSLSVSLSIGIQVHVFSPLIDLSFITLDKAKTPISLSL